MNRSAPTLAKVAYLPRTIGTYVQCVAGLVVAEQYGAPRAFPLLVAAAIVWPHVLYIRTRGRGNEAELQNYGLDALLAGPFWALLSFPILPTLGTVAVLTVNALINGGVRLLLTCLAAFVASGALVWCIHPTPLQSETTRLTLAACAPILILYPALVGWTAHATTRRLAATRRALREEKQRSEALLLNVLPAMIADRLKSNDGRPIAEAFDEVTVLFGDIVGFTGLAERLAPDRLVDLLNKIFSTFDALAGSLGLEKIKTIGDAYMVAGGLPTPRGDHAEAIAEMAIGMQEAVLALSRDLEIPLTMRIGLHSGPAIAGVIGKQKFSYDLWGDTVNTASRMESHGMPGRIQVSEAAFERLRYKYTFEERGTIEIKGKGPQRVFILQGRV